MDLVWKDAIYLVALCVGFLSLYFFTRSAAPRQTEVVAPPPPDPTPADPHSLDSVLQSMSARLSATEGRVGAIAAELQAVAIMQQRLAALEAAMPKVQDAYEQYGDQVSRADKRATERARVENKKQADFQTAGEAASLLGPGGAGVQAMPTTPPAPHNGRRPGVRGRGKY